MTTHTKNRPDRSVASFLEPPNKLLSVALLAVFAVNQVMITAVSGALGIPSGMEGMPHLFRISEAGAMEIMMPMLNEDGMTTHLQMMPTITEVAGDPNTGDATADGMAVMMANGAPFYAPEGVTFDDPIGALDQWSAYENAVTLSGELDARYTDIINRFTCNFCCGSPGQVTVNGRCGCAHSAAARGFFKYMLDRYGNAYTNDQLMGEAYRWQALWYPAGAVEDYLLATGRGDAIGHKTHGGAGGDGMHGMAATN